jgi:restriction system protein
MEGGSNKRSGELIRKLFELLMPNPDGLKAKDALIALEKVVTLTPHEAGDYESGGRRFEKIVRFGSLGCVKAGWLAKHKGIWSVTDAGIAAYKKYASPEIFYNEAGKLYQKWKKDQTLEFDTNEISKVEMSDSKFAGDAFDIDTIEEQASDEIEIYLQKLHWHEVQNLVGDLLRAMGYHVIWEAKIGHKGSDIIAFQDPLGAQSPRIRVEVKKEQNAVSLEVVKSFISSIGIHDLGVFVSIGGFTKDATEYARNHETKRVTLIDSTKFVELWINHMHKLPIEASQKLQLVPTYFLSRSKVSRTPQSPRGNPP